MEEIYGMKIKKNKKRHGTPRHSRYARLREVCLPVPAQSSLRSAPQERVNTGAMRPDGLPVSC